MKKNHISAFIIILIAGTIVGCSSSNEATGDGGSGDQTKLTVYSSANEQTAKEVFQKIVKAFEQENSNIKVELQFPGQEYENLMKVKMAANDMPDVFDTHGWSQIRYGDFLADLRDQSWASQLTDSMKPVVTDQEGKVYVLPLNEAKDGITYNVEILEKYGIEIPKTFDELMAAAEKIKNESNGEVSPFFFSGIDAGTIGQFFDYFAIPLFISPEENDAEELLNNTFDWSKWTYLSAKFKEIHDQGYMNKDVLTAKYSDLPPLFADGRIAFVMSGPQMVEQARQINPDIKIGYMPVPAIVEGDEPTFSGGERFTMGIWKDSKNTDEASMLIDYFAKPENLKLIAEATGLPAGIKGIDADLGDLTQYYEQYAANRVFPYFDRVYLPNGMWDVMCTQGQELLAGSITPQQFSEIMEREVERLNGQQQN